MTIFHPSQPMNGIPPENYFLVADSANITVAEGFLIQMFHPNLFPERPLNMFISIRSKGAAGQDMLLGALLAHAYQLHQKAQGMKTRVFSQVDVQDMSMLSFYTEGGFQPDDALDSYKLSAPNAKPNAPMGYSMGAVSLQTPQEQHAFLSRINSHRLDVLQFPLFQQYMTTPHFLALYFARGHDIVGEILFAGHGGMAKLISLYIVPNFRRIGLAKSMIAAGMRILEEQGVTHVEGDIIRRNVFHNMLKKSCDAAFLRTLHFYPGVNFD